MNSCILVEVRDFDPPASLIPAKGKKKGKKTKKAKAERLKEVRLPSSNFESIKKSSDFLGQAEIAGCEILDLQVGAEESIVHVPLRPKGGMTKKESCFVQGRLQIGLKLHDVQLGDQFQNPVEVCIELLSAKGLPVSRCGDIPDSFAECRVDGKLVGDSGVMINQRNPE
jgi:hypothetical protein